MRDKLSGQDKPSGFAWMGPPRSAISTAKGVMIAVGAGLTIAAASLWVPHLDAAAPDNEGSSATLTSTVDTSTVILRETDGAGAQRSAEAFASATVPSSRMTWPDDSLAGLSAMDAPTYANLATATLAHRGDAADEHDRFGVEASQVLEADTHRMR